MYEFSPYIVRNKDFLQELTSTRSEKEKNQLIREATAEQILAIIEICINILNFNYTLTKTQRRKLAKYADFYRSLARIKSEKGARKKLQEGRGIILGTLLTPIIETLAEQLISKLSK